MGRQQTNKAYLPFEQHRDFGRKLHDALQVLSEYEAALSLHHKKSETTGLKSSITKAMAAINAVRNEGENLLCTTVPHSKHTCNVCAVYYGPFGDQK